MTDIYNQQTSKFLHGVRGLVMVNGNIEAAVQNVNATESADADLVRVMGSRYIQGKELKDKIVEGNIETLMFDPKSQLLMQLTEPTKSGTDGNAPIADDLGTPLDYDSTRIVSQADLTSPKTDFSLMPVFDIECRSTVLVTDTDADSGSAANKFEYFGFTIKNAMITSYELRMNKDTFWLANVSFVADKINRVSQN